jgi:serine/threonine-protein phosphatase 2A activator
MLQQARTLQRRQCHRRAKSTLDFKHNTTQTMNPPLQDPQGVDAGTGTGTGIGIDIQPKSLTILDPSSPHTFIQPAKRIHEGHDVPQFLTSKAYGDIGLFVMQLNLSMCPRKLSGSKHVETWQLDSSIALSEPVRKLQELLTSIDAIIEEAPPDTGPRRFGNISFRKWYEFLESRVHDLLQSHLPRNVVEYGGTDGVSALDELTPYLLGAFGSPQRLDYGTGHELSFLAFLGCIWKLDGFTKDARPDGTLERSIVIGVIEPYVALFVITNFSSTNILI